LEVDPPAEADRRCPLSFRGAAAIAVHLGLRDGEQRVFRWYVDLQTQMHRESGGTGLVCPRMFGQPSMAHAT
jgi:hypothetical protein